MRVISVLSTEIQTTFHETMYHGFSNYYWALNIPLGTADARVRKRRHGVLADKADFTVDEIEKNMQYVIIKICNNNNNNNSSSPDAIIILFKLSSQNVPGNEIKHLNYNS